jgi:hypothetical protein
MVTAQQVLVVAHEGQPQEEVRKLQQLQELVL